MKIILSRKGFDSENGQIASPIFPNDKMISFPIPSDNEHIRFSDLRFNQNLTYFDLITSLQSRKRQENRLKRSQSCHFDPDIYPELLERSKDWLPLFGQTGSSQTHLNNQKVTIGDIFLFFGWFKHISKLNDVYQYNKLQGSGLHVNVGYFQIGKIISEEAQLEDWMIYHPHADDFNLSRTNTIYVAKKTLSFNNNLQGASPFFQFDENLVLTKKHT